VLNERRSKIEGKPERDFNYYKKGVVRGRNVAKEKKKQREKVGS